jgi:prepilin-type N-terminal cleavage/methylation domain-containing protein
MRARSEKILSWPVYLFVALRIPIIKSSIPYKSRKNGGFTLVEVAIVLLISGLLLAGATALLMNYMHQTKIRATEYRLQVIDEAMELFLDLNGRYPCVSAPDAPVDDADFGFEIADCGTAPAAGGGRDGRPIRIGSLPVRTLNLPDDVIGDSWGNRFTYAVTEALAEDGTYNRTEGGIFIVDSADNDVVSDPDDGPGTAHFVVVSHGNNGVGARILDGNAGLPCNGGTAEAENCDGDATFRTTLLISKAESANFFDDFLIFRATTAFGQQVPSGAVMAFNLSACPDGWVAFAAANGRFVVGADGATYNVGATGGSETVTLTTGEVGVFQSSVGINPAAIPGGTTFGQGTGSAITAHENRPPYVALLYCQRA